MSRWESTEIIDKKINEITKTRGTQNVHISDKKGDRPKQEADYDTDIRMASAPPSLPMIPTPYQLQKIETSTKSDLEHQNHTELGGHIQTVKDLPGLENQKELTCIENQKELPGLENQIMQYGPDVNRGHGNIDNQPKTNIRMDLQTDLEINNQHNTIPTPLLTP